MWNSIVVYQTEFVTQAELAALQIYLNHGGTEILDSAASLSKDEYGNKHKQSLTQGKGQLINLNGKADLDEIRQVALKASAQGLPEVTFKEENGTQHKSCNWRVVKQTDGSYLVSSLNLGKHNADLTIGLMGNKPIQVTDLFTQNALKPQFSLMPSGVKLLKVVVK
ncbi:hypothetical protein [Algibacillus agarilyticus]|uniref:hypothetical protein n=1 Tax=Algibacillus agarilyticus TaxID=2234133 RepID=UPI0013003D7D|nr:hypothetical protein [Algibacillus agarilyticus]